MKEKLFYVGVKGLIKNSQGKVLLLLADITTHRKNTEPYWDIPGGRIQQGDNALTTLKREIAEETGIASIGTSQFLTSVISNHEIPLDDGTLAGLVLMIYTVNTPDGDAVVISEEHSAYEWVDVVEAAERLSHKYPAEFTDMLTK